MNEQLEGTSPIPPKGLRLSTENIKEGAESVGGRLLRGDTCPLQLIGAMLGCVPRNARLSSCFERIQILRF